MPIILSEDQRKNLTAAVHAAARNNMTAGATDRAAAERDVSALYALLGFAPPAFVWHTSPFALGMTEIYHTLELPFAHLPQAFTIAQMVECGTTKDVIPAPALVAMVSRARATAPLDFGRNIASRLSALGRDAEARVNINVAGLALYRRQVVQESPDRRMLANLASLFRRMAPMLSSALEDCPCAPPAAAGYAFDKALAAMAGLREEEELLGRLLRLSVNAWVFPYQHLCLMAERPLSIRLDEQGFLHSETGPALRYPENLGMYFYLGVAASGKALALPADEISWDDVNTRAPSDHHSFVMRLRANKSDRYKPVEKIITDKYGRLHCYSRKYLPDIKILHVTNSTAEPDGSFKEYKLRVPPAIQTPLEGVAWTFDMRPEQYIKTQKMT